MPQTEHSQVVNAPLEFAWDQLVQKVYHPDRFLIGVTDVKILEDGPGNRAVRQMTIGGKITILEEITWDKETRLVDFRILEHPSHTGNVINRIDTKKNEATGEDEHWITYRMDWTFKGEGEDPMGEMKINKAVETSIAYIESQKPQ